MIGGNIGQTVRGYGNSIAVLMKMFICLFHKIQLLNSASCYHVTPEGSTDGDSRSLGIQIDLQVKPQIAVIKIII